MDLISLVLVLFLFFSKKEEDLETSGVQESTGNDSSGRCHAHTERALSIVDKCNIDAHLL